jgi:hypothetical protein
MSKKSLRQRLVAQRAEELETIANRLLTSPTAEVREHLDRLEVYARLLTLLQPRLSREWLLAVFVAVLSLAGAGLLWGLQVGATRLTLDLQSEAVVVKLAQPWTWRGELPLDTRQVELATLTALETPELFAPLSSEDDNAWIRLQGGKAALEKLQLGHHGILEIDTLQKDHLEVYVHQAAMDGRFMVWGTTRVQAGVVPGTLSIDIERELFVPETIVFRAEGKGARPVQLKLCPGEPWVLRHLPVQGLAFTRQIPTEPGENPFVSTIKSGTLTLTDVGQQVTLQENDSLSFIGLQGRLAEVRSGDALHLRFEGTARQVALGPAGFQQSLAPSLLKYYYHQEPLKFFWGAVVFLWGMLWGIRKTVLH